jgi:hypothetical protein
VANISGPVSTPAKAAASGSGGGGSHPGSDYYVNIASGTIQRQSDPVAAAALIASGWAGPFTWAQAKNYAGSQTGSAVASQTAGVISQATGLFAIGHWLGDIVTSLTNVAMWRSLGWLGLGVLLIVVGLLLWLRGTEAFKGLASAAGTAALAA